MLDIPEDYEAYQMNSTAGTDTVGILCRRPDGGVSDIFKRMNKHAVSGICPACGRDMQEVRTGTFTCKTGHLLIVMTNADATARRSGAPQIISKLPAKRTVTYKRPALKAFPPSKKSAIVKSTAQVNIADAVANALKEASQ